MPPPPPSSMWRWGQLILRQDCGWGGGEGGADETVLLGAFEVAEFREMESGPAERIRRQDQTAPYSRDPVLLRHGGSGERLSCGWIVPLPSYNDI